MKIELLYFDGCPHHEPLLTHLRELLAGAGVRESVELREIDADGAGGERFLGSPTVRVDGRDVEPGAEARDDFALQCRLYRTDDGLRPTPPVGWILAALRA
ncbi:MAG: DF family (seleno)protein [Solirubrobacteraceae bacterium]